MGNCGSSDGFKNAEERNKFEAERKRDRMLDQKLRNEMVTDNRIYKLLLLGPGESGKSTFFKQLAFGFGNGYNDQERLGFVSTIRSNVIFYVAELCKRTQDGSLDHNVPIAKENEQAAEDIIKMSESDVGLELDGEAAKLIRTLWNDPGIQETWKLRSSVQVPESTQYFVEKRLDALVDTEYVPSDEDLLLLRTRTTGILEQRFTIESNQFLIVDVGGQRSERRKWINCFDNVTAVLFVASIGGYDQAVWEDESTNRLVEALNLFEKTVNEKAFKNISFVLFLNKEDLFRRKIQKTPLTVAFPDYTGPSDFDSATEFIKSKFSNVVANENKQLFMHLTCATDSDKVMVVFNAVRDTVIKGLLQDQGLL